MKLLRGAFLTLGIVLWAFSGHAQEIRGTVSAGDQKQGVEFAVVFLDGTDHGILTDKLGDFSITGVGEGDYWLVVTAVGYKTRYVRVQVPARGAVEMSIDIERLDVFMPEVLVEATSLTGGGAGLRQIPGAAHYIDPEEIKKFQYSDVHRLLQRVPGVHIQEEDGFGLRPNIGLRGTGVDRSAKITLMEDGILMAPAPYAAPAAYYFPTVGRMQGIEVMKGGAQVRFGPYTTGGVINLLSTAIPSEQMARVEMQAGDFGFRQLHAAAGAQFGQLGVLGETYQLSSDGFKRLPGGVETPIGRRDYLLKARWTSKPTATYFQSIQAKIGQTTEDSDETYLGLSEADFEADPYQRYAASALDNIRADQRQYSLQYSITDSRRWSFQATAYRNDFYRNWYKLDYLVDASGSTVGAADILDVPASNERSIAILRGEETVGAERVAVKANQREYYAQGVQSVFGYRFTSGQWRHRIDVGYRYHEDAMDRFQWVDLYALTGGQLSLREKGEPGTESNRIESARAHAGFLQYRLESSRWTIIPGLRFEDILMTREDYGRNDPERTGAALTIRDNKVQVWIPGIGIHYALTDRTDLFGGVHRGFAPPGSRPDTRPEYSVNYETGVRSEWDAGEIQLTGYYNSYSNLLGLDLLAGGGAGTQDLFNGGEATMYGVEAMLSIDALSGQGEGLWSLPLTLAYTFSHGRFDHAFESDYEPWGTVERGDALPYLSPHQLAWSAGLEKGRWSLQFNGKWNAAMRTVAGQGDIPADRIIPAYHVMDLSVRWLWTDNLGLSFRVQNLTNEVYLVARRPAGLRPGMPRLAIFGMHWNL